MWRTAWRSSAFLRPLRPSGPQLLGPLPHGFALALAEAAPRLFVVVGGCRFTHRRILFLMQLRAAGLVISTVTVVAMGQGLLLES